jgi:hypothetical protein
MLDMGYTVDSAVGYRLATQAGHNHSKSAESEQISSWRNVVRHSAVLFIFWSAKTLSEALTVSAVPTKLLTSMMLAGAAGAIGASSNRSCRHGTRTPNSEELTEQDFE